MLPTCFLPRLSASRLVTNHHKVFGQMLSKSRCFLWLFRALQCEHNCNVMISDLTHIHNAGCAHNAGLEQQGCRTGLGRTDYWPVNVQGSPCSQGPFPPRIKIHSMLTSCLGAQNEREQRIAAKKQQLREERDLRRKHEFTKRCVAQLQERRQKASCSECAYIRPVPVHVPGLSPTTC